MQRRGFFGWLGGMLAGIVGAPVLAKTKSPGPPRDIGPVPSPSDEVCLSGRGTGRTTRMLLRVLYHVSSATKPMRITVVAAREGQAMLFRDRLFGAATALDVSARQNVAFDGPAVVFYPPWLGGGEVRVTCRSISHCCKPFEANAEYSDHWAKEVCDDPNPVDQHLEA